MLLCNLFWRKTRVLSRYRLLTWDLDPTDASRMSPAIIVGGRLQMRRGRSRPRVVVQGDDRRVGSGHRSRTAMKHFAAVQGLGGDERSAHMEEEGNSGSVGLGLLFLCRLRWSIGAIGGVKVNKSWTCCKARPN